MDETNHGLVLEAPRPKDWIQGGIVGSDVPVINASGQWVDYLPDFEAQNRGLETMSCVSFSALNCLEILTGFVDGNISLGFSDRFLAKMSGTTKEGNSLRTVAETIRTIGLIYEEDWPWPPLPTSWDVFYCDIPSEVKRLAIVPLDYSWRWVNVTVDEMKSALTKGPLQVCNQYHAFCVVGYDDDGWLTFDTYGNGRGHLPFSYKFEAAMLHNFGFNQKPTMPDIKDNSLVVLTDTGERLMKVGEKLYADDSGKILTEATCRNAKDGMSQPIPIWHGMSAQFDKVPRLMLNGRPAYTYENGQRLEIATFTAGAPLPVTPWYASTYGEGVSLRLKGVCLMLVPLIVSIAGNFGLELKSDAITGGFEALFALTGFGIYIWGQVQASRRK